MRKTHLDVLTNILPGLISILQLFAKFAKHMNV